MSNRALIGAGVIAMLIGCRTTGHPGPPRAEAVSPLDEGAAPGSPPPGNAGVAFERPDDPTDGGVDAPEPPDDGGRTGQYEPCPDDPNCTLGNGAGIYTAETGFAGITVLMSGHEAPRRTVMITHFTSSLTWPTKVPVSLTHVYFSSFVKQWIQGTGSVDFAEYQGQKFEVMGVQETNTVPTWILRNPTATVLVTDTQLLDLKLHITLAVSGRDPVKAVLDFDAASTPALADNFKRIVRRYNMRWQNTTDFPSSGPQQYCHGPNHRPDMAVFQAGIAVDPMNGKVTRQGTGIDVTLSCSLGAPATVYAWGYPYRGLPDDTFYFDAGIHMKRASYCGDANAYTVTGTQIQIRDDKPVQTESINFLEARWDRDGAFCVNYDKPNYLRHPELGFKGTCGNQTKPKCVPPPQKQPPPQYLADGPKTLLQAP